MSSRFRPGSGRRARFSAALLLAAALVSGCNYGFRGGGGFPSSIQTIYIAPFENETVQFELGQQLFAELLERVPPALGIRPAGEEAADAILRGRITRYDDVAQNYRPGEAGRGAQVLQHEVQVGISVELIDVERNVILWESSGLTGRGQYQPDSQTDQQGRTEAVEELVQLILDGAQSQW